MYYRRHIWESTNLNLLAESYLCKQEKIRHLQNPMHTSYRLSINPKFGQCTPISLERQICSCYKLTTETDNYIVRVWSSKLHCVLQKSVFYLEIQPIHEWDQCNNMKADSCSAPPGVRCYCMSYTEILLPLISFNDSQKAAICKTPLKSLV